MDAARVFALAILCLPGWLSFKACAVDSPELRFSPIASGFHFPVQAMQADDGRGRLYVVEQEGRIQVVEPATGQSELFLDMGDRTLYFEGGREGLLNAAFPPGFGKKRYFY